MSKHRLTLSDVASRINAAIKRIPANAINEYRRFYFIQDKTQARIVILFLTFIILFFGLTDYQILGFSFAFYILLTLRLAVVTYSVLEYFVLKRITDYRSYDRSLFVYLLSFVAFSLLVNLTRYEIYQVHAIIASITIFAFYLVLPTWFLNQAVLSLSYSVAEVLIIMLNVQQAENPAFLTSIFSLAISNVLAALSSWQLHTYRWRVFKDVTARKKSERLAAIGQTAGMVGHDLRNPLQAIVSDTYIIKEDLSALPESLEKKEVLESLANIEGQIAYMNKVVADLQDYTRPLKPELVEVNLCKVIPENVLGVKIPVYLKTRIICDSPQLKIKVDLAFLKRIITNLVTNAVQAMPIGGTLTVRVFRQEDKAIITIEDTGIGIPIELQNKLFTPLFTTKAKGQGFGLVVVKRMVEELRGTITFESKEGKGTKFALAFPLEQ